MKVGIIQSNYIPWRGYFDFVDDVDLFIVYDDVQYTKHDWRNRNLVKTSGGLQWLTVPVDFSLSNKTLIQDTKIQCGGDWIEKHKRQIRLSYSTAPYFEQYVGEFFDLLDKRHETISSLNISLICWALAKLGIKTKIRMSSEFSPVGVRTDRLIDILKKAGADSYLSGPAAKDYLEENKLRESGIALEYKSYDYSPYPQLWGEFIGKVTILDLLANCGPDARKYLKSRSPNILVN